MPQYIINQNQQQNGDHEVHDATNGCTYMPKPENQIDLGFHASCHGAVTSARSRWRDSRINGCYFCCRPCHTS